MTQPIYADTPAAFICPKPTTFTVTYGTRAKVLVDQYANANASGSLPSYYGGCTVLDLVASSTDASNRDLEIYVATVLYTTGSSDSIAINGTNITRTTGSFLTDGFRVGDLFMAFAADNVSRNGDDGILGIITAVAALQLDFNGTPYSNVGEHFNNGTRLCTVGLRLRAPIAANSGNGTIPNVSLLNNAMDTAQCRFEQKLGANNLLIGRMPVAVGALPATVTVVPTLARY